MKIKPPSFLKIVKWSLGIGATLFLLCMIGILSFLIYFDFNRIKPQLSRLIFEATGRQLVIHGPLRLKINLEPSLLLTDIHFQNASWGTQPELAAIKQFELQLALKPLLKGRIEIKRCLLLNPDILVETNSSGEWNLDLNWARPPNEQNDPIALKNTWKLSLGELEIKNGRLMIKNGRSGRGYFIMIDRLQLKAFETEQLARFEFSGKYEQTPFAVQGAVQAPRDWNWETQPWKVQFTLNSHAIYIAGDGIVQGRLGRANLDWAFSLQSPDWTPLSQIFGYTLPQIGPISINGRLQYRDSGEALPSFLNAWDVDAAIHTLEMNVTLNGSFREIDEQITMNFDYSAEGPNLARTLKIKDPRQRFYHPFQIQGHLTNQGPKIFTFSKIQAHLGRSDFSGNVIMDRSQKPFHLQAVLSSSRLDLRPYLTHSATKNKKDCGQGFEKPCKAFSSLPFHLLLPWQFETSCDLRIGQLVFSQMVVENVKASIKQNEKTLLIKLANSAVSGGFLNGMMTIHPSKQKTTILAEFTGRNLELGKMPRDLHLRQAIEGQLDLDINLKSQGQSMADWMANLEGNTILIMKNGRINNQYIGLWGTDLATSFFGLFNQSKEEKLTDFNCLVNRFDIEKGLARATVLLLDTPASRVIGQGAINLQTEEIDLKLRPLPKKGIGLKGIGRINLSLGAIAKPFKLSGTLIKPTLALDPAQTFLTVGKFIGAAAAFGFAGLAVVLISGNLDDADACQKAVKLAQKGPSKEKPAPRNTMIDNK